MRRLALCCLFVIGVSGLIAKQPPPPPPPAEELIWWDANYKTISTEANGDFKLYGGCWGYGNSGSDYMVWMVASDKFGGTHTLSPNTGNAGGFWLGWWNWGANYNGQLMWNEFSLVVPKDSKYWNEIDLHGTSNISLYLYNFDIYPPGKCVSFSHNNKLKLP